MFPTEFKPEITIRCDSVFHMVTCLYNIQDNIR